MREARHSAADWHAASPAGFSVLRRLPSASGVRGRIHEAAPFRTFRRRDSMVRPPLTACVVAGLVAFGSSATPSFAFVPTSLTFFGDSLTDAGNGDLIVAGFGLPDLTPSPPYAVGVVSDGPVWAQHFAAALGRATDAAPSLPPVSSRNFAIGTARTGQAGALGLPVGMLSQLDAYRSASWATDPTGLYAIFGGANDIFDAATQPTDAAREAAVVAAVDNLATISRDLYDLGARHFLVPNAFDVGRSPAGRAGNGDLLGALSRSFNAHLAESLGDLAATLPGSTFYGLALDVLQDNLAYDARYGSTRYGLTNTSTPCFDAGAPACTVSVFADDQHPTTAFHELIAEAALARVVNGVDVSPVPEPVPAVLLAIGMGCLGLLLRRRTGGNLALV
jgi:phospholipase/lecithinase/hemolysin